MDGDGEKVIQQVAPVIVPEPVVDAPIATPLVEKVEETKPVEETEKVEETKPVEETEKVEETKTTKSFFGKKNIKKGSKGKK